MNSILDLKIFLTDISQRFFVCTYMNSNCSDIEMNLFETHEKHVSRHKHARFKPQNFDFVRQAYSRYAKCACYILTKSTEQILSGFRLEKRQSLSLLAIQT